MTYGLYSDQKIRQLSVRSPRSMPQIFNCLLIACPQRPYGVQLMFPQRPYTIYETLTAVKIDNKIYVNEDFIYIDFY